TDDAVALADAGCFAIVLECVPDAVARVITEAVPVPTIGIGAGRHCDGQILVWHDLLGFGPPNTRRPKFVLAYAEFDRYPSDDFAPAPLVLHTTRAGPPYPGYPEVEAAIDGTCVRLAVADTPARRERGLRGVGDLRPYAGLLFAQRGDTNAAFTMAGLTHPLDIVWYAAAGV